MYPPIPAGSSPAFLNCSETYSAARLCAGLPVFRPSMPSFASASTCDHHRVFCVCEKRAKGTNKRIANSRRMLDRIHRSIGESNAVPTAASQHSEPDSSLSSFRCVSPSSRNRVTEKPSRCWIKIENPRYSQAEGREELFERV